MIPEKKIGKVSIAVCYKFFSIRLRRYHGSSASVFWKLFFFPDAVVDRSAVLIYTHTTGRGNCNAIDAMDSDQQTLLMYVDFSFV